MQPFVSRIAFGSRRAFATSTINLAARGSFKDALPHPPTNIVNKAIPAETNPDAIPGSTLASFNNMFARGPNVGPEVITKFGFVLSDNSKIEEPMILLNGSAFLWRVPQDKNELPMQNWDLDVFKIFEVVTPKPELIMFGTGKQFAPMPAHVRQHFYKLGIQVDVMNTKNAAATYNVLAEEGRRIAAALLPLGRRDEK